MICNKEEWKEILSKKGNALAYSPSNVRNDRELVIEAIKKTSRSIRFASSTLRDDFLVANALIDSWSSNYLATPSSFQYLSARIKSSKEFSKKAFKQDTGVFPYLNEDFIRDPNFYLKVFKQDNWEYLTNLHKYSLSKNPIFNIEALLTIDLTSLRLQQRLTIVQKMIGLKENILVYAALLNCLKLETWQINHCEDLLFWQRFPQTQENIFKACKELGENCLLCHPPV